MIKDTSIFERMIYFEHYYEFSSNYFFTGTSLSQLEEYGIELTKKLEAESKKEFTGIVKHFSIIVPYLDSAKETERFIEHFRESISIARDCYRYFSGIILIEFDREWRKYGLNKWFWRALDYMKTLTRVQYIFLFPADETKEKAKEFYRALSSINVLVYIELDSDDLQRNLINIPDIISMYGYSISEPVLDELIQVLKKRKDDFSNTIEFLRKWITQISLNRDIFEEIHPEITREDVKLLDKPTTSKKNRTIGFTTH